MINDLVEQINGSKGQMMAWDKVAFCFVIVSSILPWLIKYLGKGFTTIGNFLEDSEGEGR